MEERFSRWLNKASEKLVALTMLGIVFLAVYQVLIYMSN
jgi:hypothetical protein